MSRTRLTATRVAIVAVAVTALACSDRAPERAPQVSELPSPAGPGSGEPNLTLDPEGGVLLSWIESGADSGASVRVSRWDGSAWGTTHTIVTGVPLFVNWADFPSVAVALDGRLVAHWLQRSGPDTYSYDAMIARSTDGGATWSAGFPLHRDGLEAEHGFVSLWPASADSIAAVWLDGRKSAMADSAREMQLAYTTIAPDGGFGAERMLDTRICDCCQTAVAPTPTGAVVVYRDRTDDEVRDIYVIRLVDGEWSEPMPVHQDQWTINACPVNGPAIAARGALVAVAWFTAARDTARVRLAFSSDGGETFAAPIEIDDGNPAGRVDVELLADGRAVVSWLERTGGDSAAVRMRAVQQTGERGTAWTVAATSGARASGFPRMVRAGDGLVVAWTASAPDSAARVRVARVDLSTP